MIPEIDPLRAAAAATPETIAVIDRVAERRLRYDTLDQRVDDLAAGLLAVGIGPADRVVVPGRLAGVTIEVVHAIRRCGAIVVPLAPNLDDERRDRRVEMIDPTAVIATDSGWEALPEAHELGRIRDRGRTVSEDVPDHPIEPDETAAILFTSGTTGRPKAVRLTARNLTTSAIASAFRLGLGAKDRWLWCLEPHQMGGFAPIVRTAIYGTGIVVQAFEPAEITRAIRSDAPTGISVAPIMLRRLLDADVPLDALRVVLVGGAEAGPELVERALGADVPVHVSYGVTETCSHVCAATPQALQEAPRTVGRPLRWTDMSVVDESGDPVAPETEGELVVRGPTVSPGYLEGPGGDRLDGTGTFRSGDRGYVDAVGRVFVTGRADDRIVTGAVVVDPRAVERALVSHPDVIAAAVVGRDDPEWGERVCALLEADEPALVDPESVIDAVADELAAAERPRQVDVVAELPRTPSGTVDRVRVREHFARESTEL